MFFTKVIKFALSALLCSMAVMQTFAQQNLANNGGFETGNTSGWSSFGGCSISAQTANVHSGNYAALVTNRTAAWNGIGQSLLGVLQTNQTYTISAWLRLVSGPNQSMALTMMKTDAGGTTYSQFASGSVSTNGWVQLSGQYTFNANGIVTNLFLYAEVPSSSNAAYYIDDLLVPWLNPTNGQSTVDWNNVGQRIDGFGASSAWMSGTLPTATADLLFSTNTGAGLSLLRTRIAPDVTTWEGNIAQQAQARGARIWSTPWSPPVNYKDTNSVNGGRFVSSAANYQGYAAQLANYVKTMNSTYGIQLYGISLQNEPDIATSYESCIWTGQQFHDFLPYLSNALTASNVAYAKIIMPESMFWRFDLATNAMNDVTTSNMVGVLAGHNYNNSLAPPVTQFGTPCPKTLWETEHYLGTDDTITNGLAVAQEIHLFMTSAQANAYHYWWLTGSGTGSIANDPAKPAKRLFAMGQWSRFVRPNFYRIGSTNTSAALISAFADPASSNFVVVVANNSAFSINQTITLTNFPLVGPLRQWVTSSTESLANRGGAVSVINNTFALTLAPWTVQTFVYQPPVTNPPTIWMQPASVVALPGTMVSFSVQASGGTAPLFYQWRYNGTNNLIGATNSMFTLASAVLTNAGNYSVVITNFAGNSVTSSVANLAFNTIVWSAPVTISGAADVATNGTSLYAYNCSGSSATVNGVSFVGVNSSTAWGTGVSLGGMDATDTSSYAGGTSTPWNGLPTVYKTILKGGAYNAGSVATVALNNLTNGRQYAVQVWVNDSRSGNTTNRTEILPGASNSTVTLAFNSTYTGGGVGQFALGTFTAYATNQSFTIDGSASSQLNAIQVRDITVFPPSITQQPTNVIAYVKSSAVFTVLAGGTAPLNYQWVFNTNSPLAAATNFSLTRTNLALTNAGNYFVVITNSAGSLTSAVAVLTVLPLPQPVINSVRISGTNLIYSGTNGLINGGPFYSLSSTNLQTPIANWVVVSTNNFGPNGIFSVTNVLTPYIPQSFYILRLP